LFLILLAAARYPALLAGESAPQFASPACPPLSSQPQGDHAASFLLDLDGVWRGMPHQHRYSTMSTVSKPLLGVNIA
jgi:hypothetical protein